MSNEQEQQDQTTESEFDQAFSEAAAEQDESADTKDADTSTDEETGTENGSEQDAGGEEPGEPDETRKEDDLQAQLEAERKARQEAEQRMRSWEGRLRKSSEQLDKERKARQDIEKRLASLEEQNNAGARQSLQDFVTEWGDDESMAPVVALVRERLTAAEAKADTDEEASTGDETAEQGPAEPSAEDLKAHFAAIESKHSDFREIGGDLNKWIESLTGKDALKYERIAKEGTAEEVIGMLDAFKADKHGGDKTDTTDDADAMAAVRHRSSGRRPKGQADKNDFDGAWAEAVGQK